MSNNETHMSKYAANRVFTIADERVMRLSPRLAEEIGLIESILLLQIEFWLGISNNIRDGRKWVYKSLSDLERELPFRGKSTINRALHSLLARGLIFEGNYNTYKFDRTRWFSLNLEEIATLSSIKLVDRSGTPSDQSGTGSEQNGTRKLQTGSRAGQNGTREGQNSTTIPERTTERTSDNTTYIPPEGPQHSPQSKPPRPSNEEVIERLSRSPILNEELLTKLLPLLDALPADCPPPDDFEGALYLLDDIDEYIQIWGRPRPGRMQ